MKLRKISIENFRLLKDASLSIEDLSTVIVGRNNSGKTSLAELFRRILTDGSTQFQLEDFNLSTHKRFWEAYQLFNENGDSREIEEMIPSLQVTLELQYDRETDDLGSLSTFIIDLDLETDFAIAKLKYSMKEGVLEQFFSDINISNGDETAQKNQFFKSLQGRIKTFFQLNLFAIDPTDHNNTKRIELTKLRTLIQIGFISAQRGLDDETHKEKDFLGKTLEKLISTSVVPNATPEDKEKMKQLEEVVKDIQNKIDTDFNYSLNKLIPALQTFGYPGLSDPRISTETILDTKRLLGNHTKLKYLSESTIGLPESYNGLGSRNLIYILFQLFEFFKDYQTKGIAAGTQVIFIEEPEAHLHPQMQEVFIKKLGEIKKQFSEQLPEGNEWPAQFIVTTHSTHLANEASFDSIKYFLSKKNEGIETTIKDLKLGFKTPKADKEFLHKYMTLTRCDLFFADKAILVEGATERILLPKMIEKHDESSSQKIGNQYISRIEVGGAYAHKFYQLLDFLELPTLIITDLDSTKAEVGSNGKTVYKKCKVSEGTHTSNAVLRTWFDDASISPTQLLNKKEEELISEKKRLCFEVREEELSVCGRSFEDAFILANCELFNIQDLSDEEKEDQSWNEAENIDKIQFALEYGVNNLDWVVPKYIRDGFTWLANTQSTNQGSHEYA